MDLAIAYSRNNNVDQAIHILSELIKQNPSSAQAHANLATVHDQQSRYRESGCGILHRGLGNHVDAEKISRPNPG
jgi:Flp pilus assembly protein TadD